MLSGCGKIASSAFYADFIIRATQITTLSGRHDTPLLMRTEHIIVHSYLYLALRPFCLYLLQGLRLDILQRLGWLNPERFDIPLHSHEIYGNLQSIASSFRFYLVGSRMKFITSHRPVVLPQQRTDSQHTSSSLSEIRLIVERHLFYTLFLNIAAEVTGTRLQIVGSNHHFSTALQHLSAHIIYVWTGYLSRTSHHDIVGRIRTIATGAMGAEKIIPAVAVNQISSLAVDGDIDGFVAFHPLTCLRVKFYQTDKSEIGTITEPESAGSRVEQQARINGITVFIIQ